MKYILICLTCSICLISCGTGGDPIEREKQEMKAFFDDSKLLIPYRGVKIALRVDYADKSAGNAKIGETGLKTLSSVSDMVMRDSLPKGLSGMYALYQQIKSLYELKKEINAINEDELPTIFHRLAAVEQRLSAKPEVMGSIEKNVFGTYNNSTEHFLLGCIWFVLPSAPADIYIYEAAQIKEAEIAKPDQRLMASLLKALVCSQKEWYYTSEQSATAYLDYVDMHKQEVLEATTYLDSMPGADPEKRFYELRGMGYALRGYARDKTGREKEANEDFDHFVDDLDRSAVQNKELCFLATYLSIRNSKPEKAEKFLLRMERMKSYNEHDKQTVEELRAFLKDKNGKAFNKYFDSFSLARIAFHYIYRVTEKSDMAASLKSHPQTREMMAMPKRVNEAMNQAENMLSPDSLVNGAGDLVKKLFE